MKQRTSLQLVLTAVLAALALALSFLEGLLPPLPIPGARLGLANVVVMYALCALSPASAAGITAVKAGFALLRGPMACLMSAAGGGLAWVAMRLCRPCYPKHMSFIGLGIAGAAAHNGGQLLVSVAVLGTAMWYYTPVLLLLAVPTGAVTGTVLNVLYPYLQPPGLKQGKV